MRNQSRYPGTRPFLEEDRHLFFGRDHEKKKLSNLIVLEKLVVLFGKSGYGKSSLLNAGVIPYLRHTKHHFPIKIRLMPQEIESKGLKKKPLEILKDHLLPQIKIIKNDLEQKSGVPCFLAEKLDLPKLLPEDLTATLWYYIKFIQLTKQINEATTLIFYQFEELFRYFDDSEQVKFGRSIAVLLNSNPPDEVLALISENIDSFTDQELDQLYEPLNLKVVLSVASDHLSLLNKLKRSLPEIFKYTYELKALNKLQAQKALEGPAQKEEEFNSPKFSFDKKAIDKILDYLIKVKNKEGIELENQDIETFQLQLIGKYAEEKIIAKKKKVEQIAKLKVPLNKQKENQEATKYEFNLKDLGEPSNILKKFYNKTIAGLSPIKGQRVRKLIEKGLIIGGNRVPMSGPVIKRDYKVSEETLGKLEDKHLLRSDFKLKDGRSTKSYEISHFNLIKPIQDASRRRKRNWLWILVFILLLIIAGLLARVFSLINQPFPDPVVIEEKVEVSNGLIINAIATSTALPFEGEAPLEVEFTFSEIKPIREVSVGTYNWDFGDGTTSSNNEPVLRHTYKIPGNYRACLTVIASDSLVRPPRTEEVLIVVRSTTPIVNIKAEPDSGNAPLEVDFSATISEGILVSKYLWEFSHLKPSKEANPTHIFKDKGEYNVRLTAWDTAGIRYIDTTKITVGPIGPFVSEPPVAIAKAFDLEDQDPLTFRFSGEESTDDIGVVRYLWEFHDGSFSEAKDTLYTFETVGNYNVRLTVWDKEDQSDSDTLNLKIPHPKLVILPSDTLGIAPFKVNFDVNNTFDTYLWEFPDSTSSTLASPSYEFGIVGTYDVYLSVTDINGRPASTKTTITVKPPPPNAIASASPTQGKVPLPVNFKGSDTAVNGSESTYEWDFKNGSFSTEQNPEYVFNKPDTLEVQLTVTNKHGLIDRDTIQIRVLPDELPVADIETKVISSNSMPLTAEFDGRGSTDDGTIVNYDWYFGDGSRIIDSGDAPVKHTYTDAGTYYVELRVKDDHGQPGSTTESITVNPIKSERDTIEGEKWMERFIRVQKEHLSSFENSNTWKNQQIIPDSLNLMGILIPDSLVENKTTDFKQSALLFFFTTKGMKKGKVKVYKFRDEIKVYKSDSTMLSERFNLNGLIRQAKRYRGYKDTTIIRKYITPNKIPVYYELSNFKDLAELLEQNKINNKTLNFYYTLFPYLHFKKDIREEIKEIYTLLKPKMIFEKNLEE
jgi:PKD repeat protein